MSSASLRAIDSAVKIEAFGLILRVIFIFNSGHIHAVPTDGDPGILLPSVKIARLLQFFVILLNSFAFSDLNKFFPIYVLNSIVICNLR